MLLLLVLSIFMHISLQNLYKKIRSITAVLSNPAQAYIFILWHVQNTYTITFFEHQAKKGLCNIVQRREV